MNGLALLAAYWLFNLTSLNFEVMFSFFLNFALIDCEFFFNSALVELCADVDCAFVNDRIKSENNCKYFELAKVDVMSNLDCYQKQFYLEI